MHMHSSSEQGYMINIQVARCTSLIMTLMSVLNNLSFVFILGWNGAIYNHCRNKVL